MEEERQRLRKRKKRRFRSLASHYKLSEVELHGGSGRSLSYERTKRSVQNGKGSLKGHVLSFATLVALGEATANSQTNSQVQVNQVLCCCSQCGWAACCSQPAEAVEKGF